jgi:ureidoacrylate peracid hydrolase
MSYKTCFLLLDMQNDLCHPKGAYAKHGLHATHIPQILPHVVEAIHFCHKNKIPVIASCLTMLTDPEGKAVGLVGIKKVRPFLEKEGLRSGTWGHDLLEEIPKVHYKISKWTLSPFYHSELDHHLFALGCETLILTGYTTNGAVETAARDSVGRGLKTITLTDCVAAYSDTLHQASLANLSSFGQTMTAKEWMQNYKSGT